MIEQMTGQKYKPVWRSFYGHVVVMVLCVISALTISLKLNLGPVSLKWLWFTLLVVLAGVALNMAYRRQSVTLIVKPNEIALEKGFLGRHSTVISTRNIRTIQVKQSIMQRLLNTGDILVASSGTDGYEISIAKMPNPYAIREAIQTHERSVEKTED